MASTTRAQVLSLQTQCLTSLLHHLDDYPVDLLSCLPTRQKKELLMGLPPLDICKLEASGVGEDVDMNEVWHVVCKLCDETDNIRLTGNPCFDDRYLNYRKEEDLENSFYDRDSKVKGDWRTHFLTRTMQILLHSFDSNSLPEAPVHNPRCDRARPDIPERDCVDLKCDCWGCGVDPTHQIFLQRLMAVPSHSNIAKSFSKLERRSEYFKDVPNLQCDGSLLVPFRYAKYFTEDIEISVIDLLRMLVKGCQFRPKLVPVHCEFFHHSELYQLYISQSNALAGALFAELMSDSESMEFYWVGGLRGKGTNGEMAFDANPSIHVPKLFLETALGSSDPKLDTICFRVYGSASHFGIDKPKLDGCLSDVAPLFSSCNTLPANAPYRGLKKLHFIGEFKEKTSGDAITSIVLHQTVIEGIEIQCDSKIISPAYILEPIQSILMQPCLQFFVITLWREYDLKDLFQNFLDVNPEYEIKFVTSAYEVVIPARNHNPDHPCKVWRVMFPFSVTNCNTFSWLHEAGLDGTLQSIKVKSPVNGSKNIECFLSYLTTCRALTHEVKGPYSGSIISRCFNKLSCNKNLIVLRIHGCLPFTSQIGKFHEMLSAIYTNCKDSLTEVSLMNNRISTLSQEDLRVFFETLLSFANLSQLSINLKGNTLKDNQLDLLIKVWQEVAAERKLKSLLLDNSDQEEKIEEMVLEW